MKTNPLIGKIDVEVAERRRAEEALRESQALYFSLVDQMPAGIFRKDPQGRFVFVNSWYCRIKGMTAEHILGKTPKEVAAVKLAGQSGKYSEAAENQLAVQGTDHHELIMATGRQIEVDEEYPGADGKMQHLHVVKSALFGSDGKIIGTQGILFVVTERKQAEAELSHERDLLRALLDNSPDSIYFKDAQSRFLKTSESQARLLGMKSVDELVGKSDFDFFTEEHARPAFEDEQEIIRTGRPLIGKVEKEVLKDGRESWALTNKMPLRNKDGQIIGTFGISKDITERRRLEAQLFQSQKMETVGKLAGGIAHEFNSILTAIIGQSELLLGDLPPGSPLAKNATEITKAANRAASLTRQLLAYGRKQFLQPESLDLNLVVAGMETMFHNLMGTDVDVQLVPAADLHLVKADAGQIEQVIMNMVINARDAMPNGGKLILETANVAFDQESVGRFPELKPGGYVMLAITDTGTGMSDAVKARAFEPFFSTKGVGEGTGLGLSTCYGIIKQSGGHISVYSEQGRGSTFKIYLPQVESPVKIPVPRLDSPDLPGGTETILLVEDDPALREMAATLLRRLGYTVLTAANGVEALSVKHDRSTGHIDLLFTDVVMPHMSGKELADRVRALYPQMKILFTSAYTENAIVHQGVLDKGVDLLQKPFTPSALARKLREVLDQKKHPQTDHGKTDSK
jgi:two-component system, cell cycle sensor histidine kinase and response regulator CckA